MSFEESSSRFTDVFDEAGDSPPETSALTMEEVGQVDEAAQSWSPRVKHVLRQWLHRAYGWSYIHRNCASYYQKRHKMLSIPTLLCATLSSSAALSRIENLSIAVTTSSVMTTLLLGLQTLLKYESRAEQHQQLHCMYNIFVRKLHSFIVLREAAVESDAAALLRSLRLELDSLTTHKLHIPTHVLDQYRETFEGKMTLIDEYKI